MKYLSFALLFLAGSVLATEDWVTVRDGLDDEITHYVEEVDTPVDVVEAFERDVPTLPSVPTTPTIPVRPGSPTIPTVPTVPTTPAPGRVDIDQIINTGLKIWKIITDNKPTLNATHVYANALPKGVKDGEELDGFSGAQYRSYRLYGKNLFNSTVYDVTYTTVHRFGGNYAGRGRYLDAVTVLPRKIDVSWGYNVTFGVDRVSAANVGNKELPIASLLMEMTFRVHTAMKVSERRALFEFRGDTAEVVALQ